MKQISASHIFDADLNPSNADCRGYVYIDDIYLDKHSGHSEEFLRIMERNNIKLGIPQKNEHAYYGLYVPKKELEKQIDP